MLLKAIINHVVYLYRYQLYNQMSFNLNQPWQQSYPKEGQLCDLGGFQDKRCLGGTEKAASHNAYWIWAGQEYNYGLEK